MYNKLSEQEMNLRVVKAQSKFISDLDIKCWDGTGREVCLRQSILARTLKNSWPKLEVVVQLPSKYLFHFTKTIYSVCLEMNVECQIR